MTVTGGYREIPVSNGRIRGVRTYRFAFNEDYFVIYRGMSRQKVHVAFCVASP